MTTDLMPFTYQDAAVRVVIVDGEPWFVARDICNVIGLANVAMAMARLSDDEKALEQIQTAGGPQRMTVISESGLYELVVRSDKLAAAGFRRWVTREVLPTIRKTGGYSATASADYEDMTAVPVVVGAEHHLYVVEIPDVGVKVGISTKPKNRVAAHRRDALAYGRSIERVWISLPHIEARANERALIRSFGGGTCREYLPIGFDAALKAIECLPRTRADRSAHERKVEATANFFKSFITGGRA